MTRSAAEEALLPCPFCGNVVSLEINGGLDFPYAIMCRAFDCSCNPGNRFRTKEQAIKAWNTRKKLEGEDDKV